MKTWDASGVDCKNEFRAGVVGKQNTAQRRRRAVIHAANGYDSLSTVCSGASISELRPVSLFVASKHKYRTDFIPAPCPKCLAILRRQIEAEHETARRTNLAMGFKTAPAAPQLFYLLVTAADAAQCDPMDHMFEEDGKTAVLSACDQNTIRALAKSRGYQNFSIVSKRG